jgi:hypothetical protein
VARARLAARAAAALTTRIRIPFCHDVSRARESTGTFRPIIVTQTKTKDNGYRGETKTEHRRDNGVPGFVVSDHALTPLFAFVGSHAASTTLIFLLKIAMLIVDAASAQAAIPSSRISCKTRLKVESGAMHMVRYVSRKGSQTKSIA